MNGWQRIGVVLSVLFGIPAFLVAYSENSRAYGYITPSEKVQALKGQAFWDALYAEAKQTDPDRYEGCIQSSIRMHSPYSSYNSEFTVSCDKTPIHSFGASILWGLLPGAVIWVIGATFAWIIAGFRTKASNGKPPASET